MFAIKNIRSDFPVIKKLEETGGVYLDSGASAQKPKSVINAVTNFYTNDYANIHRGLYNLSASATNYYNSARKTVAKFLNSPENDVIFTKGTTEGINLCAHIISKKMLTKGDEIIITEAEHHSNVIPWQIIRDEKQLKLKIWPITENGELDLKELKTLITEKTKLIAVSGMSNVLGTVFPIKDIIEEAHKHNIKVLVDGAQHIVHNKVDIKKLDPDFYVFSGHKLYGPTGVGIAYIKNADNYPPYQSGGDMIETVCFNETKYAKSPAKFEAGTPPIASIIGLSVAIKYIEELGFDNIRKHEKEIFDYAWKKLTKISGINLISKAKNKTGVIAFTVKDIASFDVGAMLAAKNICLRVGYHCAEPLHKKLNINNSLRISFGLYNNKNDIDIFIKSLKEMLTLLKK